MSVIDFQAKRLRSLVIHDYVGDKKVVCFSCGSASRELRIAGCNVLAIGENDILIPNHWFTQQEIAETFPTYFDATSGHLSMELMLLIANRFKEYLGFLSDDEYDVHCGSGETLVCLKLAYPEKKFNAIYNVPELKAETAYNKKAPLNQLVKLLANKVII